MMNPTEPLHQTWQQVFGTPGTVETVPRPETDTAEGLDEAMVEYGGGPSFDQRYSTPRLDWTFQSRNLGRHDGHSANVVVTRNDTGLPWTDGWTQGDGALAALITAAMADLDNHQDALPASPPTSTHPKARFALGQVVATPGALAALRAAGQHPQDLIRRHTAGNWGDLTPEDKRTNERALRTGGRLLSTYTLNDSTTKVWIITEADRSATTLLLPAEY